MRTTVVAPNTWAAHCLRLEAATARAIAVRILPIERVAARLAGGFLEPIDRISTLDAVRDAIEVACPREFERAKDLPGLVRAASSTLMKVWAAGIDLTGRAGTNDRLQAMAELEAEVLRRLPASSSRPANLVRQALARMEHAPAVLGPIRIYGRTEMSPVWRRLIEALAEVVPVTWVAGARALPGWLPAKVHQEVSAAATAPRRFFSCADSVHEALEAVRWARELISAGRAKPEEIAICAASPYAYDAELSSIASDAALPVHFIHGRPAVEGRDGQEAAALADILLNGLSLQRFRRLAGLAKGSAFRALPDGWNRILPRDAALTTIGRWQAMLEAITEWPGGAAFKEPLLGILAALNGGAKNAGTASASCLGAPAKAIWDRGLLEGPAEALLTTLSGMAVKDDIEGLASVVWGPVSAVASFPRPFVRMIGLASGSWPRGLSEDPLLPSHVIDPVELNPLPIADADRRDFATILACVGGDVTASRPRRDGTGRLLGPSPLWPLGEEQELVKTRSPQRAATIGDRLAARPDEFLASPLGEAARGTWRDWHVPAVTPHDGRVRANHPAVLEALERPMSASTVKRLLTNPIGWLFGEVMSLREPDPEEEPFELDPLNFGNLVHAIIEHAVHALEKAGGLVAAPEAAIHAACAEATANVAKEVELKLPVPPLRLWRLKLDEAQAMATAALQPSFMPALPGQKSWAEVPFGKATAGDGMPWDPATPVRVGGIAVSGKVDRIDVSGDGRRARVIDWKTGRFPRDGVPAGIGGGSEVQRPIYAAAVQQLAGIEEVEAGLAYLRDGKWNAVNDPAASLALLARRLEAMRQAAAAGLLLPGQAAGDRYDDFSFALPGDAKERYLREKLPAVTLALGDAALVWGDP